ncbi:MAG TPA: PQQ-dependent sugar dehydrogenase [Steroidobacteraceae bacterium]|nr:PQQ-dependent sugar dehydrogenase [Steroidobacteraceae bacterium]
MKRSLLLATLVSLGVMLSACGGGDSSDRQEANLPPPPPPADTAAPSVPTGVTAAAQSATSVLVSWTASTDGTGIAEYRVFRDAGAVPVGTTTSTSFTDTGLTPATAYSYTVVAVDSAPTPNVSAPSTAVSATTQAAPPVRLALQRVYTGITGLTAPHSMLRVPNDNSRWVVIQQDGQAVGFEDRADVTATTNVLDIRDRVVFRNVHGLLGLAFHPNYPTDARAFAAYTHETSPGVIVLRISAFSSADSGATLTAASEQILFEMAQPGGHNNGGHLLFGPDGFLYVGTGDGGNDDSASGVAGNGQLTNNLLGKVLRIDVNGSTGARPYRIPADNPFAANALCNSDGTGTADCPEIFAWGFRNPWRFSFDSANGALWLGDVGARSREEVNRVQRGGNYGWRCYEGTMQTTLVCGTPTTPLMPPVAEYARAAGQSVIAGFVYHGSAIPGLIGQFVFADYNLQRIWYIPTSTAPTRTITAAEGWLSSINAASFAQDRDGELFLVDVRTRSLYKLVPAP